MQSKPGSPRLPTAEELSAEPRRGAIPQRPVFGWRSLRGHAAQGAPSVDQLPHVLLTSSGRAAIYLALRQLRLTPESRVLVPTYHCPTMVAPILLAGGQPSFFGIDAQGRPDLSQISPAQAANARAMIVPHYFGLPQSMAAVRAWCDHHHIVLIEDCAHTFFGQAGERPVGQWGDFATASATKFFPVPEAGVLASRQPLPQSPLLTLHAPTFKQQVKGWVDVLELGVRYRRLPGLNTVLGLLLGLKNIARNSKDDEVADAGEAAAPDVEQMMVECEMQRREQRPQAVATWLLRRLPRAGIGRRRLRNYQGFEQAFAGVPHICPLLARPAGATAPYVFPLWIDTPEWADFVYLSLRRQGFAVFRWDRIWPGTPAIADDQGALWSRQVLQLLCHQDIDSATVGRTAQALLALLKAARVHGAAAPVPAPKAMTPNPTRQIHSEAHS